MINRRVKLIIIIIAGVIAAFLTIHSYKKQTRNIIDDIVNNKDLVNILIAGRNRYLDNTFSFFALVTINPVNNNIGITFLPPDYRIMMNDDGTKLRKISDLDFYYFDRIQYTLKKDIQMNVPFYIKVYAEDVEKTVNLLEGINIFTLDQPGYYHDSQFGLNYLDGLRTIKYINSTEKNSIYIKYDRILDIFMTLYTSRDNIKNLLTYDFLMEIFENIKTNIMPQELYSISKILLNKGNIDSTLLPGGFNNGLYVVDEISYKAYQQEFLTNLVVKNTTEPNIKIKILNGTNTPGLARKLRNILIKDGLNVMEFGTSNYPAQQNSIIICRRSDLLTVNKISEITGIERIYFVTNTTQLNNILIIVGEDMLK